MLDSLLPGATSGHRVSIDIEAPPDRVWDALHEVTARECRLTLALLSVRSLPAIITRRGRRGQGRPRPLIDAMTEGRFRVLHADPPRMLVLGIVGQFWKPSGGVDVDIVDAEAFVDFEEPGYVKSAIDFLVASAGWGSRLSTETRNQPTDEAAARAFGRYWRLVGWGSKVIRHDILRAVKRRAERTA